MVAAGPFHPAFVILVCRFLPGGQGNRRLARRHLLFRPRGLLRRNRALHDNRPIVFRPLDLLGCECFDSIEIFLYLRPQVIRQDYRVRLCLTFRGSLRLFLSRKRECRFLLLKIAQLLGWWLGLTAQSRILVGRCNLLPVGIDSRKKRGR